MKLSIVILWEDIINWKDLVPLDYHLFSLMKEGLRGKHYASDEVAQRTVNNILRERYCLSFKGGTLLLREMVTMLRIRYEACSSVGYYSCTKEKVITF